MVRKSLKQESQEDSFEFQFKALKIADAKDDYQLPIREYVFHPIRKWRFDFAWPEYRIAVEIEGGIWVKGRHNSPQGFLKDIEKYNMATCLGWQVYRFDSGRVQDGSAIIFFRDAFKSRIDQVASIRKAEWI